MIRVKWELEEAVVLCDVYLKAGRSMNVDIDILQNLSLVMNKRAKIKGIKVDEKFRNVTGLSMQIRCIHYVATKGKEGLSNVSKVFYDAYDLFENDLDTFEAIVADFYSKY